MHQWDQRAQTPLSLQNKELSSPLPTVLHHHTALSVNWDALLLFALCEKKNIGSKISLF